MKDPRDLLISEAWLSTRLVNYCANGGIRTLGQLAAMNEAEFLRCGPSRRCPGRQTLYSAMRGLALYGLHFTNGIPDTPWAEYVRWSDNE